MNPLTRHPNAIIGGLGGGGGLGYAVLQILADYGVHLSSKQSGLLTAGCAIGVLLLAGPAKYVWANGIAGIWRRIRDGKPAGTAAAREPSAGPAGRTTVHVKLDDSAVAQLDALHAKLELVLAGQQAKPDEPPA